MTKGNPIPIDSMTEEFMLTTQKANEVYASIIASLEIDHNDEDLVNSLFQNLGNNTRSFIVALVWNNITDQQAIELREFMRETFSQIPNAPDEDILLEFAQRYPDLQEKIFKELDEFFKKWIEDFNQLLAA